MLVPPAVRGDRTGHSAVPQGRVRSHLRTRSSCTRTSVFSTATAATSSCSWTSESHAAIARSCTSFIAPAPGPVLPAAQGRGCRALPGGRSGPSTASCRRERPPQRLRSKLPADKSTASTRGRDIVRSRRSSCTAITAMPPTLALTSTGMAALAARRGRTSSNNGTGSPSSLWNGPSGQLPRPRTRATPSMERKPIEAGRAPSRRPLIAHSETCASVDSPTMDQAT